MKYVKSLDMFGVNAKEIPCIEGKGAPTSETEGAVGCFYMDTDRDNGDLYKCIAKNDGVYSWKPVDKEAVRYTKQNLTPEQKAQARENIEAASTEEVGYLKNYVTPEMFGAVCDGVTDDSTALQAACDTGEPVFIAKDIAIAKSVEVKNSVTIKDGAVVYVTEDVHGLIMRGDGMNIRGGRITTTLSEPTHALIHIDGGKYCNVQNVILDNVVKGASRKGIGVLIHPLTRTSCFNTVKDCYIFNLQYGVRIARSDAYWVTCNYIKSTINYCSTAVYASNTSSNTFDIEGQAGANEGFNANVRLDEGCTYNHCNINMVDTGNANRTKYDVSISPECSQNFVSGTVAEKVIGPYFGHVNHMSGVFPEAIPGVYDALANKEATFEPIGNATLSYTGILNYPKTGYKDILLVRNVTGDEDGVLITIPVEQGIERLFMHFSSNQSPKKVEISINGVDFQEVNWQARYVDLTNLFRYDSVVQMTALYIRLLGAQSIVNEDATVTDIASGALSGAPLIGSSRFDDVFVGIRSNGGNMTGDLTFAQNKGVVLTDANGVAYRLTVGTDGTLTATAI